MAFNIIVEDAASHEIEESMDWYELQYKGLGQQFLDAYADALDYIQLQPHAFPVLIGDYRQAVMQRFPFVVVYKVSKNLITVVAVFHTHRNPDLKIR